METIQLYEANKEFETLLSDIEEYTDPTTGEISPEFMKKIDAVSIKREELILTAGVIYLSSKADADKVDAEIARLTALKKTYGSKSVLMDNLLNKVVRLGEEFKFSTFQIKWYKNPPSVTVAENLDLCELAGTNPNLVKTTYSLDKTYIKELDKAGKPLPDGIKVDKNKHTLRIK
jgi:hypothetical protein